MEMPKDENEEKKKEQLTEKEAVAVALA